MMNEKPAACTSSYLIEELRIYVSMKMGQAAWGTHQANIQGNLLKTLGGRRTAMPAVGKNDKKDKKDKRGDKDKPEKRHGKSESARHEVAAPAVRQRSRDGREKEKARGPKRERSRGRDRAKNNRSMDRRGDRSSSKGGRSSSRGDRSVGKDHRPPRPSSKSRPKRNSTAMPAVGTSGKMGCCYREYMHKKDKSEGSTNKYPKCVFGKGCRFCHTSQPDQDLLKKWEENPPLTHEKLLDPPKLVAAPARERAATRNSSRSSRGRSSSASSKTSHSSRSSSKSSRSSTSSRSSRSDRSRERPHKERGSPARNGKDGKHKGSRDGHRSSSRSRRSSRRE